MMEAPAAFQNVNFHVVEETPFVGVKLKTEKDADFIDKARRRMTALRERMQMAPSSCVVEAIGKRPTMEDFHVCKDTVVLPEGKLPGVSHVSFFAIYDGHGGTEAAEFLSRVLFDEIMQNILRDPANVEDAIRHAYVESDKVLVGKLGDEGLSIGSTAVTVLIIGKTLYCANVGDAEAFIGRQDKSKGEFARPVGLTQVHKVTLPEEKARIESVGGHIFGGRLYGTLAISRAFGDGEMKVPKQEANYVSCVPHIVKMELTPADEFLVLACDGLWDKVTHDEACHFVAKMLHYKTLDEATEFLMEEALDRNTKDNVTVMVVNLGWSVDLSAGNDSVSSIEDLSPAFVQFLQKSLLLSNAEDFENSPVRLRISSPQIAVTSSRKDFFMRGSHPSSTASSPAPPSAESTKSVTHTGAADAASGGGGGEGPQLMIDLDSDDSYEIGATPSSVEVPKDVLLNNDLAVRQAALQIAQQEEEKQKREAATKAAVAAKPEKQRNDEDGTDEEEQESSEDAGVAEAERFKDSQKLKEQEQARNVEPSSSMSQSSGEERSRSEEKERSEEQSRSEERPKSEERVPEEQARSDEQEQEGEEDEGASEQREVLEGDSRKAEESDHPVVVVAAVLPGEEDGSEFDSGESNEDSRDASPRAPVVEVAEETGPAFASPVLSAVPALMESPVVVRSSDDSGGDMSDSSEVALSTPGTFE